MKIPPQGYLIAAAIAAGAFVAWRATKLVTDVGGAVVEGVREGAVNPANPNNLINRGVESVGRQVTGDESWTLGGAVWDWWNGDQFEREFRGQPVPVTQPDPAATEPAPAFDWSDTRTWTWAGIWGR